jgi:bacterioferritin (cytochrome b1)
MADLDILAADLITEHRKLEALKRKVEDMKSDFLSRLEMDNIGAVKVTEGTITKCTRTAKDYGDTVKNLEANLKAEKARLEHLGQFVITGVTHYLRVG